MDILNYYNLILEKWFSGKSSRKFINLALSTIQKYWNEKNIFIIEAPTGYGKSTISATIALYSLKEELKSIITFPLRTLLEDQFKKFSDIFDRKLLGKRYMHNPESRYLIKPITLTTIDTLSLTLFGIPPEDLNKVVKYKYWSGTLSGSLGHYFFALASTVLSNIILDEVHLLSDSTKSLNFLMALIKIAIECDQKLILMSATIPSILEKIIREIFPGYAEKIIFIKFSKNILSKEKSSMYAIGFDNKFVEERLKKKYDITLMKLNEKDKYQKIIDFIRKNKDIYSRVIVVFNTITDAVTFYSNFLAEFKEEKILLHSRFNEKDRENKIHQLIDLKEKKSYIIVSTQVIEAGVDISSNLFITEVAPANSLIQRLGRFLRYEGENEGRICIWYEVDGNGILKKRNVRNKDYYKVYDWDMTRRTLNQLVKNKDKLNIHVPMANGIVGYKDLLDKVYTEQFFEVKKELIDNLVAIHMNLESLPRVAIEVFFKLEGSFVRDALLVPLIPWKFISNSIDRHQLKMNYSKLTKLIVPLSFTAFRSILRKEESPIKNLIVRIRQQEMETEELVLKSIDEMSEVLFLVRYPSKLMRYLAKNDVIAFVIDLEYDENLGLIVDER